MTLIDPDGNKIKTKETIVQHSITSREGTETNRISEDSFRIPSDGKPGTWTINAKSGSNFDNIEFNVSAVAIEGMIVSVTNSPKLDGVSDFINIHVQGGKQHCRDQDNSR